MRLFLDKHRNARFNLCNAGFPATFQPVFTLSDKAKYRPAPHRLVGKCSEFVLSPSVIFPVLPYWLVSPDRRRTSERFMNRSFIEPLSGPMCLSKYSSPLGESHYPHKTKYTESYGSYMGKGMWITRTEESTKRPFPALSTPLFLHCYHIGRVG